MTKQERGAPVLFNRVVKSGIVSAFRDGFSRAEIAKKFGINTDTLHDWQRKDKSFSDAICQACDEFLKNGAEQSLKDLVLGKTVTVVTNVTTRLNKESGEMEIVRKDEETTQHPPDYKAVRFTLHNRFRNKWNKPSVTSLDLSSMTDDQLAELGEMVIELRNKKKSSDDSEDME